MASGHSDLPIIIFSCLSPSARIGIFKGNEILAARPINALTLNAATYRLAKRCNAIMANFRNRRVVIVCAL